MSGDNTKRSIFKVDVTCDGCANAVKRILNRMDGVTNVDIEEMYVRVDHTDAVTKENIKEELVRWSDAAGQGEVTSIVQEEEAVTDSVEITEEDANSFELYLQLLDEEQELKQIKTKDEEQIKRLKEIQEQIRIIDNEGGGKKRRRKKRTRKRRKKRRRKRTRKKRKSRRRKRR